MFHQGEKGDMGTPGSIGLPVSVFLQCMTSSSFFPSRLPSLLGETVVSPFALLFLTWCGNLTVVVEQVMYCWLSVKMCYMYKFVQQTIWNCTVCSYAVAESCEKCSLEVCPYSLILQSIDKSQGIISIDLRRKGFTDLCILDNFSLVTVTNMSMCWNW